MGKTNKKAKLTTTALAAAMAVSALAPVVAVGQELEKDTNAEKTYEKLWSDQVQVSTPIINGEPVAGSASLTVTKGGELKLTTVGTTVQPSLETEVFATNLDFDQYDYTNVVNRGVGGNKLNARKDEGAESYSVVEGESVGITVSNLADGEVKTSGFIPKVVLENGAEDPKIHILLNGKEYDGKEINKSGKHEINVSAVGNDGNTVVKTVLFEVNHSPEIVKEIEDIELDLGTESVLDLADYFKDIEGDDLTYIVTGGGESVTVTFKDGKAVLKGAKTGTVDLKVKSSDGVSESKAIDVSVKVGGIDIELGKNKIETDGWKLINDDNGLNLAGKLVGESGEKVTVTATINKVRKTFTIDKATGASENWELSWESKDFEYGVYSKSVTVQIKSESVNQALKFDNPVVKIKGDREDYMKVVEQYKKDMAKETKDFSNRDHAKLAEAYGAVNEYKETGTSLTKSAATSAVGALEDGVLKREYRSVLNSLKLEELNDNIEGVTIGLLREIGVKKTTGDNLDAYKSSLDQYKVDNKTSVTVDDVQRVITLVNAVVELNEDVTAGNVEKLHSAIGDLKGGELRKASIITLEVNIIAGYGGKSSLPVTVETLTSLGITGVEVSNLASYRAHLKDYSINMKNKIQDVVNVTNQLKKALTDSTLDSKEELYELSKKADLLDESQLKLGLQAVVVAVGNLLVYADNGVEADLIAVRSNVDKLPAQYAKELENIVEVTQTVHSALDSGEEREKGKAHSDVNRGLNDGKYKSELLNKLANTFINYVQENPGKVSGKNLTQAGFTDVNDRLEKGYQRGLSEVTKSKASVLTRAEIQNIINIVNGVDLFKKEKSQKSLDAVVAEIYTASSSAWKTSIQDEIDALNLQLGGDLVPEEVEDEDEVTGGTVADEDGLDDVIISGGDDPLLGKGDVQGTVVVEPGKTPGINTGGVNTPNEVPQNEIPRNEAPRDEVRNEHVGEKLPQTGAESTAGTMFGGLLLALSGLVLARRKKTKDQTQG